MKRTIFALLSLAMLVGCDSGVKTITIVSTNDIHSSIDRFPSLATLVDSLRAEGGQVLLIDAGDRRTGNPYVDKAPHSGRPIIELMNTLGYDLATMGNHEFDSGMDTLSARMADTKFPYVLANIEANGSIPSPAPYIIKDIDGIKIAFVGLITNYVNGHPDGFDTSFGNATFTDPIETMSRYRTLADSVDLLVALTHIGNDNDSLMALAIPEIPLIIGGHSHTIYPVGNKVNETLITQTGSNLRYAGVTTIKVKDGKVLSIENKLVDLKTIRPDAKYQAMVDNYNDDPELRKVIGSTTETMTKDMLCYFVPDVLREATGADLGIYNKGGIRIDALPKGDIKIADILAIEPFGNYPAIVEMSADDIKNMIISKFNMQGKEGHSIDLYPAGFEYMVVTDMTGEAINVVFEFDTKPSKGDKYRVVMSDYVSRSYKFDQKGTGIISGTKPIADHLAAYVTKNSPLDPGDDIRAKVVKRER